VNQPDGHLTTAEAIAASLVAGLCAVIVVPYAIARSGGTIPLSPILIALSTVTAFAGALAWFTRGSSANRDLLPFLFVVAGVFAALIALGWPELLPLGGGSDLAHHLQLVDYIERQWRLPQGPLAVQLIGGMVSYTPGVHLLAALVGNWTGRDGLHAIYPVLAFSAAVKAGIVFLIAQRLLPPDRAAMASAVAASLLLFLPFDYFVGTFVRASFFAQALSEMFAVAMWWALVVWSERPSTKAAAIYPLAGMGVFLTWPVWIGPPVLALMALLWMRRPGLWLRHAALALIPIAIVALAHTAGRTESAAIVQTGGSTFLPTIARFSWPFLVLSILGFAFTIRRRELHVTFILLAAIALQAAALFVVARRAGAEMPYMALKMMHLAVYPMAVLAAIAIQVCCRALIERATSARLVRWLPGDPAAWVCWAIVIVLSAAVLRIVAAGPPQTPIITEDLFLAGRWARLHVPTRCIEYLVPQDASAYWLHHAVLGNPSYPPSGTPTPVFSYRDAVVRWITRTSFPFAIADLRVLPREARDEMEERARFGAIIVGARADGQRACQ
jgi:hypothetical protein